MADIQIGTIAKLFGLSENGVRYLEEAGIVRPDRDNSGRRSYDLNDQEVLCMYRLYRQAGMQTADIARLLQSNPLVSLRAIRANLARLRSELYEIEQGVDAASDLLERAISAPRYAVEKRPPLFCFSIPSQTSAREQFDEGVRILLGKVPESFAGILFYPQDNGRAFEAHRCQLAERNVFSEATRAGNGRVRILSELPRCLHALVTCGAQNHDESYLEEPLAQLDDLGLTYSGETIAARFLYLSQETTDLRYYLEFWIPLSP